MNADDYFPGLTDDLLCVVNGQGQILEINANWKRTIHVQNTQQPKLLDLIEDDLSRERLKIFFENTHLNVMQIASCRIKDSSGQLRWFDFRIKKNTSQHLYNCSFKDITRKKVVLSVLEQMTDVCNIGYWEFNSTNNYFNCSPKVAEILGKDRNHAVSFAEFRSLISPRNFHQFENGSAKIEMTIKAVVNNQQKWFRIQGEREIFSESDYHIQGLIQDITREKNREMAQLARNIELSSFEKGLDQFSIVARTDARGKIIFANDAFCRISKYPMDELLGQDHRILNSGYHSKLFFQEMWACIKSGKSWRGQIKNKAKDGTLYWVDTIIIPFFNSAQELEEILSFRYEITELKKLQEENQELRKQLEALTEKVA